MWGDIPTHRITGNFIYELPAGKGKRYLSGGNPVVRAVLGGWEISGIYSMTSGQFMDPQWTGPDPTGTAYTTSRTPASVTIRPNHLYNANLPADQRSVNRWFDVAAFAAPTPGFFGTAAKGVIKGPGVNIWDVGLAKYFVVWERGRLRWEMTATNFFNHPNWSNPDTNISNVAQVGVISGAAGSHGLDQSGVRAFRMGVRMEW